MKHNVYTHVFRLLDNLSTIYKLFKLKQFALPPTCFNHKYKSYLLIIILIFEIILFWHILYYNLLTYKNECQMYYLKKVVCI